MGGCFAHDPTQEPMMFFPLFKYSAYCMGLHNSLSWRSLGCPVRLTMLYLKLPGEGGGKGCYLFWLLDVMMQWEARIVVARVGSLRWYPSTPCWAAVSGLQLMPISAPHFLPAPPLDPFCTQFLSCYNTWWIEEKNGDMLVVRPISWKSTGQNTGDVNQKEVAFAGRWV